MSKNTTIYVGMALTEAPYEFRGPFQAELKQVIRSLPNVRVLDFVGLESGTETDLFRHDLECATSADLCVFIVDHPSCWDFFITRIVWYYRVAT